MLTKPDLIDRGSEGEVVQVLTNVRKPLKLGCGRAPTSRKTPPRERNSSVSLTRISLPLRNEGTSW